MTAKHTKRLKDSLAGLADVVAERGDAAAAIQFDSENQAAWTGRQIGENAARLAEGLQRDGTEQGDAVVLFAPASPEFFTATLAILRAGGVVAPIDVQTSDEHIEHVLENSQAKRLFTTAQLARRLKQVESAGNVKIHILDDDSNRNWRRIFADDPGKAVEVGDDKTAVLFYTSGTTGLPKGVPLSHRNVLFQIQTIENAGIVAEGDRLLLPLPLHHVYPVVLGVLTPLAMGVPIILPHALTGGAVTRALREARATVVLGVPRLYRAIFQGLSDRVRSTGRLKSAVFFGMLSFARTANRIGKPVGRRLFRAVHERIGPDIRMLASGGSPLEPHLAENLEAIGWPVAIGYGLTETAPLLTLKQPGEGRHQSVGRAVAGVTLQIDPSVLPEESHGGDAGAGDRPQGELLARGPNVFAGYHDLPDATGKAFTDGWFRTGDLAAIDPDGYVYLHGRVSTMIVLEGGENIDPEKVEAAYEQCDAIEEIGVLEDDGKLAALVVPAREHMREHDESELTRIVRKSLEERAASLPSYQRLYRVEIRTKPLERTRLGKLQRKGLARDYADAKEGTTTKRPAAPLSESEMSSDARVLMEDARVRQLWKLLASRYRDKPLAPDASMEFDLGIDSLEWVNLSLLIEEELKIPVDDSWLERADSVQNLMELVAEATETESAQARRPIEEPETALSEADLARAQPRGPIGLCIATILYGVMYPLVQIFFRVRVRGLDNVPESGSFILLPNHVSFLDSPALSVALGYTRARRCFWGGWAGILFRNAFWRAISRLAQVVPIERERGPISSLSMGALILKREQPLVWFPEGQLSRNGALQPFRQGVGLLLEHYERPVVPVFIEGTEKALPPGRSFPSFARITVHFGKPIDPETLKREASQSDAETDPHARITQRLEEAVRELQAQAQEIST